MGVWNGISTDIVDVEGTIPEESLCKAGEGLRSDHMPRTRIGRDIRVLTEDTPETT